jgi:hypothetical protein
MVGGGNRAVLKVASEAFGGVLPTTLRITLYRCYAFHLSSEHSALLRVTLIVLSFCLVDFVFRSPWCSGSGEVFRALIKLEPAFYCASLILKKEG